jgi:hypothetical protein
MLGRIVEEHLGTIRVQALGGKGVLDPNFLGENLDCRIRWSGTPARLKLDSTNASAKPMNGTVAWRPREGKQVIRGCLAPGGRAHHWTVDFGIPR